MTRVAIIGVFVTAGTVAAAVSHDVERLPWRRALEIPGGATGWIEVREDGLLATGCRPDFGDLRVVTDDGVVVPVTHVAPTDEEPRVFPMASVAVEDTVRADPPARDIAATERVIEFDTAPLLGRDLVVAFTHPAHLETARYEAQTRSSHWRPVRAHEVDVRRGPQGGLVVGFHEKTFSRLRVILTPRKNAAGDSVFVGHREHVRTPRAPVAFHERRSGFDRRVYRLEAELDGPTRSVGQLVLESPGGFRPLEVSVDVERDGGGWRGVRTEQRVAADDRLEVTWPPERTRAVRLTVRHTDPPNVPVRLVELFAIPHRFRFYSPSESPARWVAYGDAFVTTPSSTARTAASDPFLVATLGPAAANPWYAGEPGGLEWVMRQGWLLPAAMLFVLALVGWMAITGRPVDDPEPR